MDAGACVGARVGGRVCVWSRVSDGVYAGACVRARGRERVDGSLCMGARVCAHVHASAWMRTGVCERVYAVAWMWARGCERVDAVASTRLLMRHLQLFPTPAPPHPPHPRTLPRPLQLPRAPRHAVCRSPSQGIGAPRGTIAVSLEIEPHLRLQPTPRRRTHSPSRSGAPRSHGWGARGSPTRRARSSK